MKQLMKQFRRRQLLPLLSKPRPTALLRRSRQLPVVPPPPPLIKPRPTALLLRRRQLPLPLPLSKPRQTALPLRLLPALLLRLRRTWLVPALLLPWLLPNLLLLWLLPNLLLRLR